MRNLRRISQVLAFVAAVWLTIWFARTGNPDAAIAWGILVFVDLREILSSSVKAKAA